MIRTRKKNFVYYGIRIENKKIKKQSTVEDAYKYLYVDGQKT